MRKAILLTALLLQGCISPAARMISANQYEVSIIERQHDQADYRIGLALENRAFQVCASAIGQPYPYVKYTDNRLEAVPGGDKSTLEFQCYDPHKPETFPGFKRTLRKYGHKDLPDADKTGFIPDGYILVEP